MSKSELLLVDGIGNLLLGPFSWRYLGSWQVGWAFLAQSTHSTRACLAPSCLELESLCYWSAVEVESVALDSQVRW